MGRQVALILGNGFTIDLIRHLSVRAMKIDVTNLFNNGDTLKWPVDSSPGFLSFKRCPNLWQVGARANLTSAESLTILERVVSSANAYSLKGVDTIDDREGNLFLRAYKELVYYLKYLFVHYDELMTIERTDIAQWPWAKYLERLSKNDEISNVTIVTYNYDIWLERLLLALSIPFSLPGIKEDNSAKIRLIKPHGSISYLHKSTLPKDAFQINYKNFSSDCALSDIKIHYTDLNRHTPVNFIIPPAGESGRTQSNWAHKLREESEVRMASFTKDDLAIICGISYWHVDRNEVDRLLVKMPGKINVMNINPNPSPSLDAVLNSLFDNYIHMVSSSFLEDFRCG